MTPLLVCHPGVGHSWISLNVDHSKENPTVAFSVYLIRSDLEKASIPTTGREITQVHPVPTRVRSMMVGSRAVRL